MFQKRKHVSHSMLATRDSTPLPANSLRDTITAALIREEAAESLLPGIQEDAELVALIQVLNSYNAQWWLKHLSSVGANPARYWSQQLGNEIRAAAGDKNLLSQRKSILWQFFRYFSPGKEYTLSDLELDPL